LIAGKATKRDLALSKRVYDRFCEVVDEFRDEPDTSGHNVTLAAVKFARVMVFAQIEHARKGDPAPLTGKVIPFALPPC
jgi:hypothetical protein